LSTISKIPYFTYFVCKKFGVDRDTIYTQNDKMLNNCVRLYVFDDIISMKLLPQKKGC